MTFGLVDQRWRPDMRAQWLSTGFLIFIYNTCYSNAQMLFDALKKAHIISQIICKERINHTSSCAIS